VTAHVKTAAFARISATTVANHGGASTETNGTAGDEHR